MRRGVRFASHTQCDRMKGDPWRPLGRHRFSAGALPMHRDGLPQAPEQGLRLARAREILAAEAGP